MKPYIPPADEGRPPRYPGQGRMRNFSVRVPPSIREQMEYVYKHTDAFSISNVAVRALEEYLPREIAKIRKNLGKPV
jgi:hypothetical protein